MGRRSLLSIFLLLPLLFSVGRAALTFHDVWNLLLPHSASPDETVPDHLPQGPDETVPDHLPQGELRSLPTTGEAGGDDSSADALDHRHTRVDFGTKAWPYVYYARRDREGTIDWGTKSWPFIYYSEREEHQHDDLAANPHGDAAGHYGRKVGNGFRA